LKKTAIFCLTFFVFNSLFAQIQPRVLSTKDVRRCLTIEAMREAVKKDPTLPRQWKINGEKLYNAYLKRQSLKKEAGTEDAEIIIPIVFHIVDSAAAQSWITDRDIYEQVELLNQAYSGQKADKYRRVIPEEIYKRVGRIPIKFVLARRTPSGALTSGIERRVTTTPDRINIKSTAGGGLDAWNTDKYLNVWAGTFTGGDDGLLGIATFPFTTESEEGPQGVVISIASLPYTSNVSRSYFPAYTEGATLIHETGHYFYLWHTFGDETSCNNNDFQVQSGWPLTNGAGPEGDDTPQEKDGGNAKFGNPSMNYSDGCANDSFGEMYGSFMNYFDDRALFMFSDGMRKRVLATIDMYRPGLKTSNGATPPVAVTDAFLVTVTPRGLPERREYIVNNSTLTATVRNSGTGILNAVTLNVKLDAASPVKIMFPLSLAPGSDTVLNIGSVTGASGTHSLTIFTSAPNNVADAFTGNDTIQSFLFINQSTIAAPFMESFDSNTFPPSGWQIWNPNNNTTWTRSATSGYTSPGAATVQNFDYQGGGQLDDLVTPAINFGSSDSAVLSFRVAYAAWDTLDVSTWDGIEVYVSADGGRNYQFVYKKTGNQLKTVALAQSTAFSALPSQLDRWRLEQINLTPFITPGKQMIIKFRNTNANGNNVYIDDIKVSAAKLFNRDAFPVSIVNLPSFLCGDAPTPSVVIGTSGKETLQSLKISYQLDNGNLLSQTWNGTLTSNQTATVLLPALAGLTIGKHVFTVYTSNPNGLADQNITNDTIRKTFYVFGKVAVPVTEGFESTTFPPANWGLENPDNGITWSRTTEAAKSGVASMVIKNFENNIRSTSRFMSSIISESATYDSLFVSFDYAYAQGVLGNLPDTLDLQITTDCGKTFTTIWKKWGSDLQTLANVNGATGARFVPLPADWLNIKIDLSQYKGTDFQLSFTSRANRQNNLYIDNINIYGVIVPARLKAQGYLIYPSPFRQQFIIRNYEEPVSFQNASVYNSFGQLVWTKNFNGKAFKEEIVDLTGMARGIYFVKLKYTDKTVVERVVKL
jgi:hypothetical protein